MMVRRLLLRAAAVAGVLVVSATSGAVPGVVPGVASASPRDNGAEVAGARLAFRIHDDEVTESSGLAVSRTHPGLAYTVNDSGDEARVFVLSTRDGSVVGETRLSGVEAVDMEALAPAPGGRLVVGDIGDNDAERDSVQAYVIDEPRAGDAEVDPRRVSLDYPGGARNAEAMVVAGHRLFVLTKDVLGGTVFTAPVLGGARDAYTLHRVALAPPVVTDAALLADGDVAMRDYDRGYLVHLPGWRVRRTFRLPDVDQGETVAASPRGRRILVGSEGSDSPVYTVTVPRPSSGRADDRTGRAAPAAPQDDQGNQDDQLGRPRARPPGYIVAVAAAIVIGFLVRRHRRR